MLVDRIKYSALDLRTKFFRKKYMRPLAFVDMKFRRNSPTLLILFNYDIVELKMLSVVDGFTLIEISQCFTVALLSNFSIASLFMNIDRNFFLENYTDFTYVTAARGYVLRFLIGMTGFLTRLQMEAS